MLCFTLQRLRQRLIYTAAIISLFGMISLARAADAGHVVFVVGKVQIGSQPALLGNVVQEGDEITTGSDGYVYLKTIDNGFLILRPASRARIITYKVDRQNPTETKIKLELVEGVARSISGQAVKSARQNFRFNTPVAAIGVRGTDFTVFTDQQTSRVTVLSGGVVVGGFSANCSPEGAGPCEGNASLELFANQSGQLLQIQKGQAIPQLLRNTNLAPDAVAPPHSNEPNNKLSSAPSGTTGTLLSPNDVSLDPQKNQNLLSNTKFPPSVKPPVGPSVPVVPTPPEVLWGRWQAVANLGADAEGLAKLRNGSYEPAKILDAFFISRVKQSELVLPKEGQAGFALIDSEAYIVTKGQTIAATVQDGRLDIDFAKRAFSTSLTVTAPNAQVDIQAKGDVTLKGELLSSFRGSNVTVTGYLGGANAQEAAYLFKSLDTPAVSAFGATRWSR